MTAEAAGSLDRAPRDSSTLPAANGAATSRSLSAQHKEALAAGRAEARAVRRYLEALDGHPTEHASAAEGDRVAIAERIESIDAQLAAAEPAVKVRLIQERMELYSRFKALGKRTPLDDLEKEFVAAAGAYSARKGISYAAWRQVGVDDSVLKRAGIRRA